jgi:hypothetical protein
LRSAATNSLSLSGYELVVIAKGTLHRTLIGAEDQPYDRVSGVGISRNTIALVGHERGGTMHLLEYSSLGKPLATYDLSAEQYASLNGR